MFDWRFDGMLVGIFDGIFNGMFRSKLFHARLNRREEYRTLDGMFD